MNQAYFSFDGELSDFCPSGCHANFCFERTAVKDAIEALGIPHTEVEVIVVNGVSVDFAYQLRDGDRVDVYPVSATLAIEPLTRLRPLPPYELRFVLDVH